MDINFSRKWADTVCVGGRLGLRYFGLQITATAATGCLVPAVVCACACVLCVCVLCVCVVRVCVCVCVCVCCVCYICTYVIMSIFCEVRYDY